MLRVFTNIVTLLAIGVLYLGSSTDAFAAEAENALLVSQDNPIELTEESISAGRQMYGRFCRSCHGMRADGRGMAAPPGARPANLVDDTWDHGGSDAEIFKVIKEGVPPPKKIDFK